MDINVSTRKKRTKVNRDVHDLVIKMCYEQNCKSSFIARSLGITIQTVRNILREHDSGTKLVDADQKRRATCAARNIILRNDEQALFNAIVIDNSLTLKEAATAVAESTGRHMSTSTVCRVLKKINVTRKRLSIVPNERNTESRKIERARYAAEIERINDNNLIFLDETGFNEHTKRTYGYSLKNTKAYTTAPANRNINRSLMCAISVNGVVAYSYKSGSYNAESFCEFIESKLVCHFKNNPTNILIMDNARFHSSASVTALLRANGIVSRFLVPYSPQLNPIEEFFAAIKARFKRERIAHPHLTIEDCIDEVFVAGPEYQSICENIYRHMREWLVKARNQEDFI